jgi:hypothetical protein
MANINKKAEDYMSSARISHDVLRDKLSEFLAVERGGLSSMNLALQMTDTTVSQKFREFPEQTRKHETILVRVVSALGMDPDYAAKVAEPRLCRIP